MSSTISHKLGKNDLLSKDDLSDDLRWIVFKVKQRAATSYKNQLFKHSAEVLTDEPQWVPPTDLQPAAQDVDLDITYNWPYDFFSMLELIKIDTDIEFTEVEDVEETPEIVQVKQLQTEAAIKIEDIFE